MIHVQGRRVETFTLKERVDGYHQQAQEEKGRSPTSQYTCCVRCSAGLTGSLTVDREAVDLHHSSGVATLLWVISVSCVCVLQHMTSEYFVSLPFCGKVCLFHCKGKWLRVEVKLDTWLFFEFKMNYFRCTNKIFLLLFKKKSPV